MIPATGFKENLKLLEAKATASLQNWGQFFYFLLIFSQKQLDRRQACSTKNPLKITCFCLRVL